MYLPTHASLATLNAFLEDTCVIVIVAYLMTRGRLSGLLFHGAKTWRDAIYLGVIFGAVGITEDIFPGARYPYATPTLIITFAAWVAGPRVGVVAALVVGLADLTFHPNAMASGALLGLTASLAIGSAVRRIYPNITPPGDAPLWAGFAVGFIAQTAAVILRVETATLLNTPFAGIHAAYSIPANSLGMMLLQLVLQEAWLRRESERHRLEAEQARAEVERARATIAETYLAALRARIHPHFLFNTLSSIAALCAVAPDQAEIAIIRLGELMHRALEGDPHVPVRLADEITDAQAYLQIQQLRFGNRLQIVWNADEGACACAFVPAFSLLTLLENAIGHGISPKIGKGTITISVRATVRPQGVLVSVRDDGVGMTHAARRSALAPPLTGPMHGLTLLNEQLTLLNGERGRLRLFSRRDECAKGSQLRKHRVPGTLAVFFVPAPEVVPQ